MTTPTGVAIAAGTLKLDQTLSPPVKNGLLLRLDASSTSSLVSASGVVSRWLDADGNGKYADQIAPGKRPVLVSAAQNGRPVIDFGTFQGTDAGRSMALKSPQGTSLDLTTIRTAFWVMQGRNHLLTSSSAYDFHRGGEEEISSPWSQNFASPSVTGGQTYLNGTLINGSTAALSTSFNLVSLVTTGNVGANSLCGDRVYRSGGQKIAEVILYNRALSATERQNVETYLRHKWFAGPAPASTALAGASVAAGATLDLGAGFTHSQGILTFNGNAQLNVTGSWINQATLDIRPWSGLLQTSLTNQGTILDNTIAWGNPTRIASSSDVSTAGTPLYAKYFSALASAPATTAVNGVTFTKQSNSSAELAMNNAAINSASVGPGSVTDANYQKILITPWFLAGSVTLNNLVVGLPYEVQVWAQDPRYNSGVTTNIGGGPSLEIDNITDGNLGVASQGLGQFTIGRFTAKASSHVLFFNGNQPPSSILSAIQVRSLVTADYAAWSGASNYQLTQGPTGDDDRDGLTNQAEYAFGLNPTSGASVNVMTQIDKASRTFNYTRRKPSLGTNLAYSVWFSTDLLGWTEDTGATEGSVTASGDNETVPVTLSAVPGNPLPAKLFIQVRAK